MKSQFIEWLTKNTNLDVESVVLKVTDNLDIINCNDVERSFIEDALSKYLDTLSNQELANLC